MKSLQIIVLILFSLLVACTKNPAIQSEPRLMELPVGFPPMSIPDSNAFTLERWSLGKRLFFDPILSSSNQVSCASCHKPEIAFSDNVALSIGDMNSLGTSNSPTLTNIGYNPYFTRAGGVPTLEMQILVPIQEHNEFNSNILDIAEELNHDSSYIKQSLDAYNRIPDPYVITRAIANFERSLISGDSKFDHYFYQGINNLMNESELRGYQLFTSTKANCSSCHSGFNFTNYSFQNNGLYEVYADSGRMRLTKLESDRALFKVPTLRNIELSAPYMHNGSLNTLEEVVEHYNSGGKPHPNKSNLITPLNLTYQEKKDLVAFLKTLTDYHFINNKNFKP